MADPLAGIDQVADLVQFDQLSPPIQTALFLGGLVLLPALLACLTPFTRIIIVLAFTRRAVTSQDIPPNNVLVGLALFLTLFVLAPTLEEVHTKAIVPYTDKTEGNAISKQEAIKRGVACWHKMMVRQTRKNDIALFASLAHIESIEKPEDTPIHVLIPAYVISELTTGFIIGFCIYVPFLLVDLVVANVLTAMGMMTMPPVTISAPFKVLLFVLANGWHLVIRALGVSFA